MKVAYLVNQYPGISHTFVRREIQALERLGVRVERFAVRAAKQGVISKEDKEEAQKTKYIVGASVPSLLSAMAKSIVSRPMGVLSAIPDIFRLGWRSEAGLIRHGLYFLEALALATWVREAKISHIHSHFGTNSTTVAMMAAAISGGTFSFTAHGPEEFDKPGLIALPRKIERAAFVVAISSFGASQLRRLVAPSHWAKTKIVHCGIEDSFHDGETQALPAIKRFVCVGRLCEQKGQLTLIEAAGVLKKEERPFEIVLVGDGDMRPEIEAAIERYDVRDRIVLAGWKTPAEVRTLIESSRVFVLPSYAEGLPVSIMEAFMLNRPVISTYIAGIPELVEPGENGWLAPAGDASALADAMRAAITADDETIQAMARHGKAKTAARHHIDIEAEKLASHFRHYVEAA